MNFWNDVTSSDFWYGLTYSDFNRGYLVGAAVVLGLLLLLLILRLILLLLFRTRRSGTLVVPNPDGDLVISRDAVQSAVRRVVESFDQFDVRRIQLYRKGKFYSLTLFCSYAAGDAGVPELAGKLKPQLWETLKTMFGITNLRSIRIQIEKLSVADDEDAQQDDDAAPTDIENAAASYVAPGF